MFFLTLGVVGTSVGGFSFVRGGVDMRVCGEIWWRLGGVAGVGVGICWCLGGVSEDVAWARLWLRGKIDWVVS